MRPGKLPNLDRCDVRVTFNSEIASHDRNLQRAARCNQNSVGWVCVKFVGKLR